jgi:aspartyl-tRNA(Asn)/glutamyl-tRNA(Gln) amidotransferase subunit C
VERRRQLISEDEVEHIAWLARIELSKEEKRLFLKQFNDILAYFQKISEVDTEGIEPTYHVIDLKNIFRSDEVKPSLPVEEALQNAPKREGKFIKAPRIAKK